MTQQAPVMGPLSSMFRTRVGYRRDTNKAGACTPGAMGTGVLLCARPLGTLHSVLGESWYPVLFTVRFTASAMSQTLGFVLR